MDLQEYTDETGQIWRALQEVGGFAGLKSQVGTTQKAFARLEHLLGKVSNSLQCFRTSETSWAS